jgi:hypothetical protein
MIDAVTEKKISISPDQLARLGGGHVGYIREIAADAASKALGQPIRVADDQRLFCLYQADGTPIAISPSREAALASALEHELLPMSVH